MMIEEKVNKVFPYRESIGSILLNLNKIKLGLCCGHLDKSTNQDVINVKRMLRYLNTIKDVDISYTI